MSRNRWLLLALLLFALFVRVYRVDWDQYHFFHPDERRIASAVLELSFRPLNLNPRFFAYGSFPFYVTKTVTAALGNISPWLAGYDGAVIVGRTLSAVWGTATVALLALLGARLYGRRVALLGGLLLAATVSHVQNSHFATNDIPLTFLVLLALFYLVRLVQDGARGDYLRAGLAIGLAAATKFSAMPILLPFGIAVLSRIRTEGRLAQPARWGMYGVLALLLGFVLGQPYALLDYREYIADVAEQSRMVRNAGLLPYTNQYIGVPKYLYEIQEMVLWGMAPLLGIAAIAGMAARCLAAVRGRQVAELLLLSWVLPFFLVSGSFDVKFPRYLLPIYPFLVLWGAAWLTEWADRGTIGKVARGAVVAGTLAALLAFMSIYGRPHATVTASEWAYAHIPAGSKILTQHWDEGFPMPVPGKRPDRYRIEELPYYEQDTPSKIAQISAELASADYLAFQTKRLYGAITRAPQKYPLTNKYFYLLFAGDLGYTLVKEVASRPGLFGIELPSELADESFSVYDHPKALIFKNTGRLSAEEIREKILRGIPSVSLSRRDLLFAGVESNEALAGGAGPRWLRSSAIATAVCVLFLQAVGLAAYLLLRPLLTPRVGLYALAKVVGILIFAYLTWIASSIGWVSFAQGSALAALSAVLLLGAAAYRRHPDMEWPRAEIIATEAAVWGAFFFFLVIRAFNPEIYWGEKPMDFSFLNTLYRTTALPPPEPWFAGSPLHYTYFGYFTVAAVGKALSIHPAIMFNLGVAAFGGLTAAAVFGAGAALGRRWQVGALAAALATFTGNLAGLRELVERKQVNFDYYWATSRVIRDTINEFPLWSFLFADLHAHVMVMPFTTGFVCLLIMWTQRRPKVSAHVPLLAAPAILALLALTLGAISVTNGWSTPTYLVLLPFVLTLYWLTTHEGPGIVAFILSGIGRVALPSATVVVTMLVLYLPFWRHFSPPERNFGWEQGQFAKPYDYLTIHGLFAALAAPFFFVIWRRILGGNGSLGRLRGWAFWTAIAGLAVSLLDLPALAEPALRQTPSIRAFAFILAILGLFLSVHRATPGRYRLPLALAGFAFAVTGGCDVVFIWDRMNTIFKFYLESWFLFALAGAVILWDLHTGAVARGRGAVVWKLGIGVLLALALFTTVSDVIGVLRTRRVPTPRPTLDGMAYLHQHAPHELAAYEWLNANVRGIPVMVEAFGPAYQEYSRAAMNTGLPIVLGWEYHVFQRAHSWPEINRRKADIEVIYTSATEAQVAALLDRYHVSLVFVGPLERRTYGGANLENFQKWTALLTPIYQNPGVTVFAVNGRFAGAVPVTTIEEVAPVEGGGEEAPPPAQPGQVRQPRGIAVDRAGNIYVADFGNNRVQKYDKQIQPAANWGKRGDLPGEFKDPCGIAVGPADLVYVADTWNQRVQVFDAAGKYLREWAVGFYGPRGITVDSSGAVLVADTGNHRVVKFSAEGKKEAEWGGRGDEPGKFFEPTGIATDKQGHIYVADNGNGRIQIFDRDGRLVRTFDVEGWRSEVYSEPYLIIDSKGTIWTTVPLTKQIRAYSSDGKLLKTIASPPNPPHKFETPMGIAIDPLSGTLIISDLDHRIVRLPEVAAK